MEMIVLEGPDVSPAAVPLAVCGDEAWVCSRVSGEETAAAMAETEPGPWAAVLDVPCDHDDARRHVLLVR
jgi:hypothetical protein